ncbi:MAG: hypothetical protein AAFR21_13285 [Pseudomonadota bacterium]
MTEFASDTVVNCRRMFYSAMDRIHDADILSTQIWARTDAASLLKIYQDKPSIAVSATPSAIPWKPLTVSPEMTTIPAKA